MIKVRKVKRGIEINGFLRREFMTKWSELFYEIEGHFLIECEKSTHQVHVGESSGVFQKPKHNRYDIQKSQISEGQVPQG